MLILLFPALYIMLVVLHTPIEWASGGFHWQQLMYAVYEQMLGISIITALLATGKKYWNRSSARLSILSRNTFAVYIFHPLVLISLSMLVRNWNIEPAIICLVVAPLAVAGSFLLASVLTRIPGVREVI